uniref:Uncharacterized protein n=1 Tax=Anguilla anguilla TaxID=7936 RepID=A0A0E9PS76_ANGAN
MIFNGRDCVLCFSSCIVLIKVLLAFKVTLKFQISKILCRFLLSLGIWLRVYFNGK